MSLYGLLIFSAVYLLAVASPGPGVAAVVARSLSRGTQGAVAFIAGFLVGDLIWFTLAVTGLAALAQAAQTVFVILKYIGAAYLIYLAWRLWTVPASPADARAGVSFGDKPTTVTLWWKNITDEFVVHNNAGRLGVPGQNHDVIALPSHFGLTLSKSF